MKRIVILLITLCCAAYAAAAQTSAEEYASRYSLLSSKLGPAGVGIETLLNKWEADFPQDKDMLTAKFLYYYTKAQSSSVQVLDQAKYLGTDPVISLKDSLGRDVRYFQVTEFDDEMFRQAVSALDKVIRISPDALELRMAKVSALTAYEKESPDMAAGELSALIDYNASSHPSWTYEGVALDSDAFCTLMQEYCYRMFKIGSPVSLEAFKKLSEKMSGYFPKNTDFINNLGTYYLVHRQDYKTALKYYNKVLKINSKDYSAIKNCLLAARKQKDVKLEKKYLPMLIAVTESENEKAAAQVRLDAIKNAK